MVNTFPELAKHRSDTYSFLAGIFRQELTAEQIKGMINTGVLNLLVETGAKMDLNFFNRPAEQIEEDLAVEYTALFIGPGKHIVPHESIYVPDSTGKVGYYWGECTSDFKNWVEHYGLNLSKKFESIPDHVSVELEFMQRVIEQEKLARERGDEAAVKKCIEVEKTFFNKHIINWMPLFFDRVIGSANLDFYREVAKVAKDFLIEEEAALNEVEVN